MFAVEILVQAVVVIDAVLQKKRSRPFLTRWSCPRQTGQAAG
jgi:hypothetical protein